MFVLLYIAIRLVGYWLTTLPLLQAVEAFIVINIILTGIALVITAGFGGSSGALFNTMFGGLVNIALTIVAACLFGAVILLILYTILSYRVARNCYRRLAQNIPALAAGFLAVLVFL